MYSPNNVYSVNHRTNGWIKAVFIIAGVVLIFYLFQSCNRLFQSNAEDPNWYKENTTIRYVDEATKLFGSDLLLDKLVLKQENPKPYTEFILNYEDENSRNINDRKTWRILSCEVNYNGERFGVEDDTVELTIFFKENDPCLVGSARYPDDGYESQLKGSKTTKTVNGTTVLYRESYEYADGSFKKFFWSEFKHLGYTYFFESYSKENKNLSWDTIRQMLGS